MKRIKLYAIGSLGAIVETIIAYGGDAQKARPAVRSLDMPKTVISNFSKDSELVFSVSVIELFESLC